MLKTFSWSFPTGFGLTKYYFIAQVNVAISGFAVFINCWNPSHKKYFGGTAKDCCCSSFS